MLPCQHASCFVPRAFARAPKPISPDSLTWVSSHCPHYPFRHSIYRCCPYKYLFLCASCLPLWHHAAASLLFLCLCLKSIPPINKTTTFPFRPCGRASFPISESGFWTTKCYYVCAIKQLKVIAMGGWGSGIGVIIHNWAKSLKWISWMSSREKSFRWTMQIVYG